MKKIIILIIPIIILVSFYYKTKKSGLHGNFDRIIQQSIKLIPIDTTYLDIEPDGILASGNEIWLNNRFSIKKIGDNSKAVITVNPLSAQNPIISFNIQNDSICFFQANTRSIRYFNKQNGHFLGELKFNFPISYFMKLEGSSYLFHENTIGNGGVRVHYKDYLKNIDRIVKGVFPDNDERGFGMKYAGLWFKSTNQNEFFFSSFRGDTIYNFDNTGNLNWKIKTIDFRNQNLKIIQENDRYYLSPESNILRIGAAAVNKYLLVSS